MLCSQIQTKTESNLTYPNFYSQAITKACEEINNRLKPIRDANKDAQWVDITKAAYTNQIGLSVLYTAKASDLKPYDVWALACAEIEIDLLTGNILVHRVDISEDVGQSMNPLIDVGQVKNCSLNKIHIFLTLFLLLLWSLDRRCIRNGLGSLAN